MSIIKRELFISIKRSKQKGQHVMVEPKCRWTLQCKNRFGM